MIDVRLLEPDEVGRVDAELPLHRLGGGGDYLVAWDGAKPVGHAYVAWSGTELGLPELQDVYVAPARRREGIATGVPPKRMLGRIVVRDAALDVDDTVVYLVKPLAVDSTAARSS